MSDDEEVVVEESSSNNGNKGNGSAAPVPAAASSNSSAAAAAIAAAAASAAADAENRIKRKRKEPPVGAPAGSSSAHPQPNGQTSVTARPAVAASAAASPPAAAASAPPPSLDAFLLSLPSSVHSQLQHEVLSLIFPNKTSHPPHLYRNLPGPLPISITRSHLQNLQQNGYWACEKSDGERAMLYVSKERQAGYLIDRKFLVRQLKHPVYAELWGAQGDTLLDGELVLREHHAAHPHSGPSAAPGQQPLANFMVFDALVVNGARTLEQKLSLRLEQIGRNVVVPYRNKYPPAAATATTAPAQQQPPTTFAAMMAAEAGGAPSTTVAAPPAPPAPVAQPPMSVGAKAFVRKHHLKDGIFDHITCLGGDEYEYKDHKRQNKNDGVIFTPEEDDYWCKSIPLLKWKWQNLNTIDFLTRYPWFDNEGRLMLYSTASMLPEQGGRGGGGGGPTATVHMRSTVLTPEKRAFFLNSVAGKETAIAEMQYDARTSSWQPKNFRWDKSSPNFMTTVIATLETIIDNVQPDDLIRACARPGQHVAPVQLKTIAPQQHQQQQQQQQQQHYQQQQPPPHRPAPPPPPPPPPAAIVRSNLSPFDAVAYAPPAAGSTYESPFG